MIKLNLFKEIRIINDKLLKLSIMKNLRIKHCFFLTIVMLIYSNIDIYASECNIKWNISINSKTKVYYLPGCWMYDETKVDAKYWEKWFCTEQEAINEWFVKSYRCPSDTIKQIEATNADSSDSVKTYSNDTNFWDSFTKWFIAFILGSVIIWGIVNFLIGLYDWWKETKLNKSKK